MNPKKEYAVHLIRIKRLLTHLFGIFMMIHMFTGTAFPVEEDQGPFSVLETVRAGRHEQHTSVVFQFEGPFTFDRPRRMGEEIRFNLPNARTQLTPYREYRISESWIRLEPEGDDIGARVGLLGKFSTYQFYTLENPDRLVINLFRPEKTMDAAGTYKNGIAELIQSAETADPTGASLKTAPQTIAPDDTAGSVPEKSPAVFAASQADVAVRKPALIAPAVAVTPQPDKTIEEPAVSPANPEIAHPAPVAPVKEEPLLTLNFYQSDIQEVLSALAIQQNINIVTEKGIDGDVTVHLYEVPFDKALGAICQSGGFDFYKEDSVYYIYKPKVETELILNKLEMRIFKLEYAEIDKIQQVLDAIPNTRLIKIHEPTKTIIVEDTLANIEKIEKLITYWDAKPKQVMIEAKILEITLTDDMSFGVNWEKLLGGDAAIGTGGFSSGTMADGAGISPVPADGEGIFANIITGAGTDWQFAAALDALETKTKINTLSTPKILAIHSKPAKVQVGGQQGYSVTTVSDGIATTSVEFIDTGTILEITPYIDDSNNVLLKVSPTINSAIIEQGIPVVNSTVVTTWLMAKDGETVFIGGLIQNAENKSRIGIPCLGNIPGLGILFGRTIQGSGKSELIVLITPRVVGDGVAGNLEEIEKADAAENRLKWENRPKFPLLMK
jgi:type IV pilus secretin PilQ/predicted competence protein